jgi:hypothetical protein
MVGERWRAGDSRAARLSRNCFDRRHPHDKHAQRHASRPGHLGAHLAVIAVAQQHARALTSVNVQWRWCWPLAEIMTDCRHHPRWIADLGLAQPVAAQADVMAEVQAELDHRTPSQPAATTPVP